MTISAAIASAALANAWAWGGSALGAFAAWLPRAPSARTTASLLGFAAGVMLAASFLGLIPQAQSLAGEGGGSQILIGFLGGVGLVWLLDLVVPHEHPGASEPDHAGVSLARHKGLLIALALMLHNIPEGMAVGASAVGAEGNPAVWSIVWAIALHNVVEGVLVAVPLRLSGYSARNAFLLAQVAGAAELAAGVLAAMLVGSIGSLLPAGLALAAGAMSFVVVEELLPEAYRLQRGNETALGACLGIVVVLLLNR
jgi:ZIP family zinc transporter